MHHHLEVGTPSNIFSKNFNTKCPSPWAIRWCKNIVENFYLLGRGQQRNRRQTDGNNVTDDRRMALAVIKLQCIQFVLAQFGTEVVFDTPYSTCIGRWCNVRYNMQCYYHVWKRVFKRKTCLRRAPGCFTVSSVLSKYSRAAGENYIVILWLSSSSQQVGLNNLYQHKLTTFCLEVSLSETDNVFCTLIFIWSCLIPLHKKLLDQGKLAPKCHVPLGVGLVGLCINPRLWNVYWKLLNMCKIWAL